MRDWAKPLLAPDALLAWRPVSLLRPVPVLVALLFFVPFIPVAAAEPEDPTTGNCDGVAVPISVQIGLVCALAGTGTNASCPPNSSVPIEATCTSLYSWTWLAYSRVQLAGEVTVTITHDVQTCVDLMNAEPVCTSHVGSTTQACAWAIGGACRDSGRIDESWGPVALAMGEEFKVLVHIDVAMQATSNAAGVPVGAIDYHDASDTGAAVNVLDDGRD